MTEKKLQTILAATKKGLQKLYGPHLKGLVLYGSYARGEATPDSDIDVAVILDLSGSLAGNTPPRAISPAG